MPGPSATNPPVAEVTQVADSARAASVIVEATVSPVVSFASAHAGVPVVSRVVVRWRADQSGPDPFDGAAELTVRLSLRDAQGRALAQDWVRAVPPESVRSTARGEHRLVLDSPALRLRAEVLSALDEETPADLVVDVLAADSPVGSDRTPVRVLAGRQWVFDPASPVTSLELLATFVQPNHPAVAPVVAAAADGLARRTGTGSLAVQYASPERVDQVVSAVLDAVHDLGLHYAEPPASWGLGQKVRSPADIVAGRVATCLDSTLLVAACLEHIGIVPVLWVTLDHAFLGYWRAPGRGLPDSASLQAMSAANAVDIDAMGVVETTLVTVPAAGDDLLRRARQAARERIATEGSLDSVVGVVDVGMARTMRLLPLPATVTAADGTVQVIQYHPGTGAYDGLPAAEGAVGQPDPATPQPSVHPNRPQAPEPPPRVRAWQHSLLDLTLRNKLLNSNLAMTRMPLQAPPDHLGELAEQLQRGRSVAVRAADDLGSSLAAEQRLEGGRLTPQIAADMLVGRRTVYSSLVRDPHKAAFERLRYRSRTTVQETGANPLYLTVGRLDWQLGERRLSAPLVLVPVHVRGIVQPYKIELDEGGAVTLNHSLMEKLKLEFGFSPTGLAELPRSADGETVDVSAVLLRVREAIDDAGLPFRVEGQAELAVIQFTGYLLWRDLNEHWERLLERPLVRHLALTPTDSFSDGAPVDAGDADLDDVVAAAPVPTDGSQASAIAAARVGHTFVLEGPPGTGKSQTITAVIADQLAHGRRVLFVAEKGAALDVVRRRLADVGLLPFALDLHDEGARPAQVRAALRAAVGLAVQADPEGFRTASSEVASAGTLLEDYAGRLHARNGAGLTLYTARERQLALGPGPTLDIDEAAVSEPVGPVTAAVSAAVPTLALLPETDSPCWGFASALPTGLDACWPLAQAADTAVARSLGLLRRTTPDVSLLVGSCASVPQLQAVAWLLSAHSIPPAVLVETRSARWSTSRAGLQIRSETLRDNATRLLVRLRPEVVQLPVREIAQAVREAEASFFIGRKRRVLAAAAPLLAQVRPGATVERGDLAALLDELSDVSADHAALVGDWGALPGVGLPAGTNLLTDAGSTALSQRLATLDRDRALLDGLGAARGAQVVSARAVAPALDESSYDVLATAAAALAQVFGSVGAREDDVRRFASRAGVLQTWQATAEARGNDAPRGLALQRWVAASEALEPLRATMPAARWQLLTGAVRAEEAVGAFDRGVAAASVTERRRTGGFELFDGQRQDLSVARFADGSARLRTELATSLPAALVGRRPFRPGVPVGRVGALHREVNRSRGGLSVRELVASYGDVLQEITPCVLVSPDSLARFVPPGAMHFDLVVFDEASQITVPDAVGALGRADAAVIAGDSKQLPPTNIMQLSQEEGADRDAASGLDEFEVVADEESILGEAVQAGVGRLWLTWHYRSQDESLIAFSNQAYYEGRLSSFPSPPPTAPGARGGPNCSDGSGGSDGSAQDSGIGFVRVDGEFIRSAGADQPGALRTNPVEARAVVAEVLRRWRLGERSIGVVTFNLQQRTLIESLLWDSGVEGVAESLAQGRDGLFVKNLENVQGDERDVVLFSTGFSANRAGVLPLNFGPLNRVGGERRLNVAVTRARRRVVVFSSFDPEDLRVEQTSSVGLHDLRRYLELAKYGVGGAPAGVVSTENGVAGTGPAPPGDDAFRRPDRHRDDIAAALRASGLAVRTGVGLSDFQVDLAVGPDERSLRLAVLLDSPAWAARTTTNDRDALPAAVLLDVMGWGGVHRVWLPAWLADPAAVVAEVLSAAHAAAVAPRRTVPRGVSTEPQDAAPEGEPQDAAPEGEPQDAVPGGEPQDAVPGSLAAPAPQLLPAPGGSPAEAYRPFVTDVVGTRSDLDGLPGGRHATQVADLLRTIVSAEGPVSTERLVRLVAHAYGLSRVVDQRAEQISATIPGDLRRDAEGFVWPDTRDPLSWNGFRTTSPGQDRPLEDVALREISNAMVDVAVTSFGVDAEELVRQTARTFGLSRVTTNTRPRLELALELACRDRRLSRDADLVTAAAQAG